MIFIATSFLDWSETHCRFSRIVVINTLGPIIDVQHKSGCPLLNGFNLVDGSLVMGVPDSRAVFKVWSYKGDVGLLFQSWVALSQVPLDES